MDPKISVVLTTYNRVNMLKKAVKSVQKQTLKDWELIIVDDYSTDGTQKYAQKLANRDSRIRYVRLGSNFGCHSRPKNEGTKLAQANLIAYLDDDNEYRKDHLQVLYKYIGDKDVVYGDRWLIDKTGKGRDMLGTAYDFNPSMLYRMNYIDTSDVLIKKKAIEEVGGWDEELKKFADWNLWVRLAKSSHSFKRVPIIITNYYVHEGCAQFRHPSGVDAQTGLPLPTFSPDACPIWPDQTLYGPRPKLKVAVFTLTMNRLDYTKRMYKSMTERAGYLFDWFVVDNGSTDDTVAFVKDKATKLITNKENVGISKASNQALDMISDKYDVIIKVDNDCEFMTDNWLRDIVHIFERQSGLILSPRVEGLRDNPGGVPRTNYIEIGNMLFGIAPHLGGLCCAAPAAIYRQFRWDENDFLHGDQDYVFSQYAINQRYLLAYMENTIVEHMDTTAGQEKNHPEYFKDRSKLKQTKYGKS